MISIAGGGETVGEFAPEKAGRDQIWNEYSRRTHLAWPNKIRWFIETAKPGEVLTLPQFGEDVECIQDRDVGTRFVIKLNNSLTSGDAPITFSIEEACEFLGVDLETFNRLMGLENGNKKGQIVEGDVGGFTVTQRGSDYKITVSGSVMLNNPPRRWTKN